MQSGAMGAVAPDMHGHKEFFIRYAAAHEIDARLRFTDVGLRNSVCGGGKSDSPGRRLGRGDCRRQGRHFAMPFNCAGMYCGVGTADGVLHTAICGEPQKYYFVPL